MEECDFQESPPLSQETLRQLFKELDEMNGTSIQDFNFEVLNEPGCNMVEDLNSTRSQVPTEVLRKWNADLPPNQCIQVPSNLPEQIRPISSLPATEDWPGRYEFSVHFDSQKTTKGVSWIFSSERNKLYVGKDVACPIKFATNVQMYTDVYIRAMALFSNTDHAAEKVTRCVNHSMEEIRNKIFEAEHLIRCESTSSLYENDVTGRHSVRVPYENPSVGQKYSTYLYKFTCFGSCAGGPNRRPLIMVFTLEDHRGEVIGRRTIHLKICACPMRDFKMDSGLKENKPVKRSSTVLDNILTPPTKLVKEEKAKNANECYWLKITDKNCYKFLKKMKCVYDTYRLIHNSKMKSLLLSQSSSGDETDGFKPEIDKLILGNNP